MSSHSKSRFSKALLKVNSKYMLGLSATPNRKDGLTKVLKWYIGDIIFSIKGSEKNLVRVERYLIDSNDENYNHEVVNYMGKAQMPTMLNNIADCRLRTKLIMKRVIEELDLNEKGNSSYYLTENSIWKICINWQLIWGYRQ